MIALTSMFFMFGLPLIAAMRDWDDWLEEYGWPSFILGFFLACISRAYDDGYFNALN